MCSKHEFVEWWFYTQQYVKEIIKTCRTQQCECEAEIKEVYHLWQNGDTIFVNTCCTADHFNIYSLNWSTIAKYRVMIEQQQELAKLGAIPVETTG